MSFYSVDGFIKEFYPQYWGYKEYPEDKVARIHKVKEQWGILGNFGNTPITVNGLTFKSSEQLFQCMKFRDVEPLMAVYKSPQSKYPAKHWEKTHRREDWGQIFLDCLKYCLVQKYEQSEEFRDTLKDTEGLFIIEDQTGFSKKNPDAYGVKLRDGKYVGPNLLGQFLMELRDMGTLHYQLPDDALDFIETIKVNI